MSCLITKEDLKRNAERLISYFRRFKTAPSQTKKKAVVKELLDWAFSDPIYLFVCYLGIVTTADTERREKIKKKNSAPVISIEQINLKDASFSPLFSNRTGITSSHVALKVGREELVDAPDMPSVGDAEYLKQRLLDVAVQKINVDFIMKVFPRLYEIEELESVNRFIDFFLEAAASTKDACKAWAETLAELIFLAGIRGNGEKGVTDTTNVLVISSLFDASLKNKPKGAKWLERYLKFIHKDPPGDEAALLCAIISHAATLGIELVLQPSSGFTSMTLEFNRGEYQKLHQAGKARKEEDRAIIYWNIPDEDCDVLKRFCTDMLSAWGDEINKFTDWHESAKEKIRLVKARLRREIQENQTYAIQEDEKDSVRFDFLPITQSGISSLAFVCEAEKYPAVGIHFFIRNGSKKFDFHGRISEEGKLEVPSRHVYGWLNNALELSILHIYHSIVVGDQSDEEGGEKQGTGREDLISRAGRSRYFRERKRKLPEGQKPHWKEDPVRRLIGESGRFGTIDENHETIVVSFWKTCRGKGVGSAYSAGGKSISESAAGPVLIYSGKDLYSIIED